MEFSKPSGAAFPAPRRVFTAPTYPSPQHQASSSRSADGSVDTLYDHPSVKIVSFTAGTRPVSISPRSGIALPEVEPGTLSWTSQLERTIAVGPFRIYRAPGSVAFLSCGSALQPILPKSQVWCADESSSKFVLQIRRPQYWRIELPFADPEDVHRAHLLREVFDKILQFEKTECPFRRTFTVELPEPPSTPVKKRPWTPVRKPSATLPPTPITPVDMPRILKRVERKESTSQIKNTGLLTDRENGAEDVPGSSGPSEGEETSHVDGNAETAPETDPEADHGASPEAPPVEGPAHSTVARLSSFYASRCMTAPPQLMLDLNPTPTQPAPEPQEPIEEESAPRSSTESQDSFHSPQSFRSTPLPPSPPLSNQASPVGSPRPPESTVQPEESPHQDTSDVTVMSNASQTWSASPTASTHSEASECATAPSSICDEADMDADADEECSSPPSPCNAPLPSTPGEPASPTSPILEDLPLTKSMSNLSLTSSLSHSSSGTTTGSTTRRPHIRHRATTSSSISPSRRALSPLPPAANLFSPRPYTHPAQHSSALAAVKKLPMAVIQKTCEILMSPPSHLINLMLKVAARIAAGEWRGLVFGVNDQGEQIPVQWDWSEDETEGVEEWWDKRRKGMVARMAGTFPESDDEESVGCASPVESMRDGEVPWGDREQDWGKGIQEEEQEEDWKMGVD